ncbi:Uncharacterised protein [Mycobacterium tuberculosis]|uniref:Uncharacterized protein n=1 Tax=Mycobacterium tuberculosis TaxID=1773 RepID=A0A916L8E0_MYCTX|nr:Uncharacterised protein [Mycobacterium tuberculosis]COX00750.1 Uncharacterised protein [Mycobacterium tuberculosis]COX04445.1 Uncharacterised protein [Mycobacterium tuberculosis]
MASVFSRTSAAPHVDSSNTLPLARMVRTLQNPASVNAVATSAILRLTPPTLTPRRNAANLAIPDCTRPPENDATAT